jgi:hypothetical protein
VFALVTGELEVNVEDVRPNVTEEAVGLRSAGHVLTRDHATHLRVAPVLGPASLAEDVVKVVNHVSRRIYVRVACLQAFVDDDAVLYA